MHKMDRYVNRFTDLKAEAAKGSQVRIRDSAGDVLSSLNTNTMSANGGSGVSRFFQALAKTVGVSPTPAKGISLTDLDSDPSPDNPLEEENDFTTQGAQRRLINHNTLMRSKSAREPLPMAEPPIPYTIDGSRWARL